MAEPQAVSPDLEPAAGPGPLDDALAEALRLVGLADRHGLLVRILGGLAFQARLPGWSGGSARAAVARRDIDLATRASDSRAVSRLLTEAGYEADTHYNALWGRKQLYFVDRGRDRPVDVIIDALEMCHRLGFRDRLAADHPTLPLAELLLSKLQVIQLNHKDAVDALALLARYPLATSDDHAINTTRIAELTANEWGWWRTTMQNLGRLGELARTDIDPSELGPAEDLRFDPLDQLERLQGLIDAAPKSSRWRLRARIGDRVKWYEEPEEVAH